MDKHRSDPELLKKVRFLTDQLRSQRIEHLEPIKQTTRSRLLRLHEVWQQIYLHRLVDLSDVAIDMFDHQRLVPGCTLTRSVIETTAVQYYIYKKIVTHTEQCDPEPIHKLLLACVFGSRDKSSPESAIQVMTAIDHLDKEFKVFREAYDHLSEYAHPNLKGGFGSYVQQKKLLESNFGTNPDQLKMGPFGLGILHLILLVAEDIHKRLCDFHPKFLKMANKHAPDRPL